MQSTEPDTFQQYHRSSSDSNTASYISSSPTASNKADHKSRTKMCLAIHFQYSCGCISQSPEGYEPCEHYNLIPDWQRWSGPEGKDQIEYCKAMCKAESRKTYRTYGEDCSRCAKAKRDELAKRAAANTGGRRKKKSGSSSK